MRRSVGVVIAGWVTGFLIAVAWGSTRASNAQLASVLSKLAIAGVVVTGFLLVSIVVSNRINRRRGAKEIDGAADVVASPAAMVAVATVTERRAAARIAALERRLAREQEELDAAAASLAAAELAATAHAVPDVSESMSDDTAAELEPMLRREVVDTVAQLMEHSADGQATVAAAEVEELLEKSRQPA